jgi:hypothetical protein
MSLASRRRIELDGRRAPRLAFPAVLYRSIGSIGRYSAATLSKQQVGLETIFQPDSFGASIRTRAIELKSPATTNLRYAGRRATSLTRSDTHSLRPQDRARASPRAFIMRRRQGPMREPPPGISPVIEREEEKVDKMTGSIGWGC